jgi:hypothetical protein
MKISNNLGCLVGAAATFIALSCPGSILTSTPGAFPGQLQAGYYSTIFPGFNIAQPGWTFSSGPYSGTINDAVGGMTLAFNSVFNPSSNPAQTITFSPLGGISGLGATFEVTDGSDNIQPGTISITANYTGGGGTESALSVAQGFYGIKAPAGTFISSITFSGAGSPNRNTIANLFAGAVAVPEPSQYGLCVGGGLLLLGAYRRFRK